MLSTIRMILFTILSIAVSTTVIAAQKPLMTADSKAVNVKIQNFNLSEPFEVAVQLRYVDDHIKYVAVKNMSQGQLRIKLFSESYILKPHQEQQVPSANVEYIVFEVETYDPTSKNEITSMSKAKVYLFKREADGLYAIYKTY